MPGAFAGHYLDGRSAARQPATIRLTATGLDIALESGARLWWPFAEVRQTQGFNAGQRSEEHTSELQSQSNLVCRLLLEKKKTIVHIRSASQLSTHVSHSLPSST